MKKEAYQVGGMTCSGCERAIKRLLTSIAGVAQADADLSTSTVSVEYDASVTTIDEIKNAITKLGYKPGAERPAAGQREGSDEAVS